jgi:hypothetical protein
MKMTKHGALSVGKAALAAHQRKQSITIEDGHRPTAVYKDVQLLVPRIVAAIVWPGFLVNHKLTSYLPQGAMTPLTGLQGRCTGSDKTPASGSAAPTTGLLCAI